MQHLAKPQAMTAMNAHLATQRVMIFQGLREKCTRLNTHDRLKGAICNMLVLLTSLRIESEMDQPDGQMELKLLCLV